MHKKETKKNTQIKTFSEELRYDVMYIKLRKYVRLHISPLFLSRGPPWCSSGCVRFAASQKVYALQPLSAGRAGPSCRRRQSVSWCSQMLLAARWAAETCAAACADSQVRILFHFFILEVARRLMVYAVTDALLFVLFFWYFAEMTDFTASSEGECRNQF